jgi:PAS domain S-box-containing protein
VSTWVEGLLLSLQRRGFPAETFPTFSYSPLFDDGGKIAGMLCVVTEDTQEVIGRRRMSILRDLGARSSVSLGEAEMVAASCRQLDEATDALPFSLVYLYDEPAGVARLAGSAGFTGGHPAAPAELPLDAQHPWPVGEALAGRSVLVDLPPRFADLPTGRWVDPPVSAVVLPLAQSGQASPYGFLVAAVNRYRPLDRGYRDFLDLVAGQLTSVITEGRAFDFERARAETLAELDHAKTDFFTNISHEFRTPLTLLLGPAEDALADPQLPLPDRQRGRVEVILRTGQRLLKLVTTLLDFSRLESGRTEAQFAPIDLAQYTRELASMFDAATERLGLSLTVDCPPLPDPVYVDAELWAKMVLNLLSNALKFTFSGGIEVHLRQVDGQVELAVVDTGTGIPQPEIPPPFERFRRVHGAASRPHEGSGLGRALVRELAELHGGTATVTSVLGVGSTFCVRVPFGPDHLPCDAVTTGGASSATPSDTEGSVEEALQLSSGPTWAPSWPAQHEGPAPRVLVVDDNADIREYVAGVLADEYHVDTAVDGADALTKAWVLHPDLVLTDGMVPRMDGVELLAARQGAPATVGVPVVMLSARAGEEGMLEGLDRGADDYLIKPFTARELKARVRANLELDRARRIRRQLERGRTLLDQAQRLAQVGSWEIDLRTAAVHVSEEYLRIAGRTAEEVAALRYPELINELVHPDDRAMVQRAFDAGVAGEPITYEARMVHPDGSAVLVSVRAEVLRDEDGEVEAIRGSVQDITERRAAEEALALATANAEAAAREHAIADQLQRSLLPETSFDLEHLEVATFYRAGVEGTQVGGDWYDVIQLGAGRTALVVGDVMGRGVQAAAVMGQLRTATRAYARLGLPPADVLEYLDGIVRDLDENQIVTCLYAVFDPADRVLRIANAGHLPPILVSADGASRVLTGAADPPLGTGPFTLAQRDVRLEAGGMAVLYTDGLVERRGEDLDRGITTLARLAGGLEGATSGMPERLVDALLPEGPDDDVAILIARVDPTEENPILIHGPEATETAAHQARSIVGRHLADHDLPERLAEDTVLATSELVTNAVLHGAGPLELRLRTRDTEVMVEVLDRATYQPRRLRPTPDDEHGRGLQIVAALASRWGTRGTEHGKSVWCVLTAG